MTTSGVDPTELSKYLISDWPYKGTSFTALEYGVNSMATTKSTKKAIVRLELIFE